MGGLIPSWRTMFFRSTWNECRPSMALKYRLWTLASILSALVQDIWSLFYSHGSHSLSCWPYPYIVAQWQREITFKRLLEEYSPNCLCGTFPAVFIKTMELPTWPYLFKNCQSLSLYDSYFPFSKDALNYDNRGTNIIGQCWYLRYVYFPVFMKEEYRHFPCS